MRSRCLPGKNAPDLLQTRTLPHPFPLHSPPFPALLPSLILFKSAITQKQPYLNKGLRHEVVNQSKQIYNHLMNKTLIFATIVAALALLVVRQDEQQPSSKYSFADFKQEFGKVYLGLGEEQYRKTVFLRNYVRIHEHNADPSNSWKMGLTQFADLTEPQFAALYLTLQAPKQAAKKVEKAQRLLGLSSQIDWRNEGAVSKVKDQGACGSCWAFAATGALESAVRVADKERNDLYSEQDLVDCSRAYGNMGCDGGWMDSAYQYILDHGIAAESDYPYTAKDGKCQQKERTSPMKDYIDTPGCDQLVNALSGQPIAVAVDASSWSLYRGGVMSKCGTGINHGVLVVGVTDDYWIVKNSWSTKWGETGYIRLARGNTCAVCSYPSYTVLSDQ